MANCKNDINFTQYNVAIWICRNRNDNSLYLPVDFKRNTSDSDVWYPELLFYRVVQCTCKYSLKMLNGSVKTISIVPHDLPTYIFIPKGPTLLFSFTSKIPPWFCCLFFCCFSYYLFLYQNVLCLYYTHIHKWLVVCTFEFSKESKTHISYYQNQHVVSVTTCNCKHVWWQFLKCFVGFMDKRKERITIKVFVCKIFNRIGDIIMLPDKWT